MSNPFIKDICNHIVSVYESNKMTINSDEVCKKFARFIMNESLTNRYTDVIDRMYGKLITESELIGFVEDVILGPVNEGFENPFDDATDNYEEAFLQSGTEQVKDKDFVSIKKVSLYDPRATRHTFVKDGRMYSGRPFVKGDLVEECPVVLLDKTDLYSRKIRDLAFEIDGERQIYGMPYGYANVYRTSSDESEGNIDYEYDPSVGNINFYAIKKIAPNDELVLLVRDSAFH